jgi:hypothetical protein
MDIQLENGFPVNPIRVRDDIVLINIFTLEDLSIELCQRQNSLGSLPSNSMANRLRAGFQS